MRAGGGIWEYAQKKWYFFCDVVPIMIITVIIILCIFVSSCYLSQDFLGYQVSTIDHLGPGQQGNLYKYGFCLSYRNSSQLCQIGLDHVQAGVLTHAQQ